MQKEIISAKEDKLERLKRIKSTSVGDIVRGLTDKEFDELWHRLYAYTWVRLGSVQNKEDVIPDIVQGMIAGLLENFGPFNGNFLSYMFRALQNRIVNFWREREQNVNITSFQYVGHRAFHPGLQSVQKRLEFEEGLQQIYTYLKNKPLYAYVFTMFVAYGGFTDLPPNFELNYTEEEEEVPLSVFARAYFYAVSQKTFSNDQKGLDEFNQWLFRARKLAKVHRELLS